MNFIEVEAELIESAREDEQGLSVNFTPALIRANFETLRAQIEEKVSIYKGFNIDIEDDGQVKMAKSARADLNAIVKELSAKRIAIKREYMNPYTEFEAQAKDIESIAKNEAEKIGSQIAEAEQAAKDKKRAHLQEFYEEFAPILVPNVPYSRLHEDGWLLKGTKLQKAEDELSAKVEKIAKDWESFKQLNLEFASACEVTFFETLDLGQAVSYNAKLVEDSLKIEAMRKEMADTEHGDEVVQECESEPVQIVNDPAVNGVQRATPVPAQIPATQVTSAPEISKPCVIIIGSATRSQMLEAGKMLRSLGITGTFKVGTLDQVYLKAHQQVISYAV